MRIYVYIQEHKIATCAGAGAEAKPAVGDLPFQVQASALLVSRTSLAELVQLDEASSASTAKPTPQYRQ